MQSLNFNSQGTPVFARYGMLYSPNAKNYKVTPSTFQKLRFPVFPAIFEYRKATQKPVNNSVFQFGTGSVPQVCGTTGVLYISKTQNDLSLKKRSPKSCRNYRKEEL